MHSHRSTGINPVVAVIPLIAASKWASAAKNEAIRTSLKYQDKPFLGFDAHTRHIGIYPYSGQVVETLKDQLHDYSFSKGAIRVPLDHPISEEMLRQIIHLRLEQITTS